MGWLFGWYEKGQLILSQHSMRDIARHNLEAQRAGPEVAALVQDQAMAKAKS